MLMCVCVCGHTLSIEGDYSSPECYGQAVTLSTVAKVMYTGTISEF